MPAIPINYTKLFEHFTTPLMIIKGGKIIQANQSAAELFKVEDPTELKDQPITFCIYEKDGSTVADEEIWQKLEKKALTNQKSSYLCKMSGPKQEKRWIEYNLSVFDKQNAVPIYLLECRDITNTTSDKVELDQIAKQKELFQDMVEHSPDVIMKFDDNYTYQYITPNCKKYSGLPPEHYINRRVDEQDFPEHILDLWYNTLKEMYRTGKPQRTEFQFPESFWMDCYVVPVKDDEKVSGALGVSRDISHIKKLEHKFRQSNKQYRALAEAYPDIMIRFDEHKHISYCTENIIDIYKLDPKGFIGKSNIDVDFPPKVAKDFSEALASVYENSTMQRREFLTPDEHVIDWYFVPAALSHEQVTEVFAFGRDVTPYKKVQSDLELNKDKLEFALNISELAFWESDIETHTFEVTPQLAQVYGIPYREEENMLMKVQDLIEHYVIKEDQQKLLSSMEERKKQRNGDDRNVEFRISKDDGIHNLVVNSRLVQINGKKMTYGTVQDVTELKKKEAELEQYRSNLEELVISRTNKLMQMQFSLSTALDLAKLGMWEYNLNTKTFTIGPRIAEIYGLNFPQDKKKASFGLETLLGLIHPEDLAKWQVYAKSVRNAKVGDILEDIEYRIITKDKEVKHIYSTTKVLEDPDKKESTRVFGIAQDITSIRKVELHSDRLYHAIEATPDLVVIVSPDLELIFLNQSAAEFYQQKAEKQVLSVDDPIIKEVFPPWVRDSVISQGVYYGENSLTRHDGKKIPVSQVTITFHRENGELDSFSSVIRDMSEHKRIEQDLIFKKHELDTFIYHASHDLRGPIASLQGLNMLIEQDMKSEEGRKYFKMYETEVNRLHNILLSLVDLTRIKDKDLQFRLINFDSLVQACIQSERHRPGYQEVTFETDIELQAPYKGDIELLTILFRNLIRNTIDFRATDRKAKTKVTVHGDGQTLRIEISDNGMGILPEVQPKIFNMFFRGNEASSGQGLGLYMVRNVIERLHGTIELDSKVEKGTVIHIHLPYRFALS